MSTLSTEEAKGMTEDAVATEASAVAAARLSTDPPTPRQPDPRPTTHQLLPPSRQEPVVGIVVSVTRV